MPNWCEDLLDIRGPKSERDRLKQQVRGTGECDETDSKKHPAEKLVDVLENPREMQELDFQKIIPMPSGLNGDSAPLPDASKEKDKERKKKYGAKDWYDWNVKYWGTKWNASEPCVYEDGNKLSYTFQTAWSPPEPVVIALAKQFPKLELTLKYWETGMGYRGILKVKGDRIIKKANYEYAGGRGG